MLRSVKYGETSVIVSVYTELFGLQSYLVNGVRVSSKKSSGRAGMFQPIALLDMVVYHNELKQLQRIREYNWGYLYRHLFADVRKNAVALFMIELLTKCLKQPEANADLFHFTEDALMHLDESEPSVAANFPLFFALHLPVFFGFRMDDNYGENNPVLDLQEGNFVKSIPPHPHFLEGDEAMVTSLLLKTRQSAELAEIRLNHVFRRNLLFAYEKFYALHLNDFGTLKTLPVLKELLG